eukprot:jgi/Ulvmu1/210/UM001_0214.1
MRYSVRACRSLYHRGTRVTRQTCSATSPDPTNPGSRKISVHMSCPTHLKRSASRPCTPEDASCKRQRTSQQGETSSSWLGKVLTRLWSTTNADAVATTLPLRYDAASRWAATGAEALRLVFGGENATPCLERVVLARRELVDGGSVSNTSASSIIAGAALAVVCACPAIPSAARAALVFATAANSVYKTMQGNLAWHHFVILEFSEASYALHLTPQGLYANGVATGQPRSQAQVHEHRKELLAKQVSDRCILLAEELKVYSVDASYPVATQAMQTWLTAVVDDPYNLCTWNCQHFTQDLLAVIAPFCEHR